MSCISREAANNITTEMTLRCYDKIVDGIYKIPAATQRADRPKGKWARVLDIHHERYWCSECMGIADKRSNFCPNCGADMREEVNDDKR